MKILELRFKNLNSLYGEWRIDFTDPEYVSNGIFSLIGPTGAGKSTILDAICLALYGATPRLGKIAKSSNEIMSRQTGECYAEVVFESQAGRFRCHWEQRRARKQSTGLLQEYEHQIAEAESGHLLATKKNEVVSTIAEKTGMDFDRFTRSILLAQGSFDTFLKADVEQKSRILEQITGSQIYSDISRHVHERQRSEQEKLNQLQAIVASIVIIEEDKEQEIQQNLVNSQQLINDFEIKSAELEKAIVWLFAIGSLKKELADITTAVAKLYSESLDFKPQRDKLTLDGRATAIEQIYQRFSMLRIQQSEDQAIFVDLNNTLLELEGSTTSLTEQLDQAEKLTLKVKNDLRESQPLLHKVRVLDQRIAEQEQVILKEIELCNNQELEIRRLGNAKIEIKGQRSEAYKKQVEALDYLKKHECDESLVTNLASIKVQLANLNIKEEEISQKANQLTLEKNNLLKARQKIEDSARQLALCKEELAVAVINLTQRRATRNKILDGSSLRELHKEKEFLVREVGYRKQIEQLESYRARLEDGRPCPLCGATEHPFAIANVPVPDEIEQQIEALNARLESVDKCEEEIKSLSEVEEKAREKLQFSEVGARIDSDRLEAYEKMVGELASTLEQFRNVFCEEKNQIICILQPYGVLELTNIASVLHELEARLNRWQEWKKIERELRERIMVFDMECRNLDVLINTQSNAWHERQRGLELLKQTNASDRKIRLETFRDYSPDRQESFLNKAVTDAEGQEKQVRSEYNNILQRLTTVRTQADANRERRIKREPDLIKIEEEFLSALHQSGFQDEQSFIEAKLTGEEREILTARARELDQRLVELNAQKKDRETRLENESIKKITTATLLELRPKLNEHREVLQAERDNVSRFRHQLSENEEARKRIQEKQAAIEAQRTDCRRWSRLHELIGSADGKKYRNFAQSLTFELLTSHANRQLKKMTDRYLLVPDNDSSLELNVTDYYQAGEVRSTRNLSGGESFIVSLALALGLSHMASRNVRVDSLFLDEGFGTLDEESLETALQTLASLPQDGKLIGIISHVSYLKDRIRTQIHVTPVNGGRSAVTGPGVVRVSG
jgi:exonuclease SbcC